MYSVIKGWENYLTKIIWINILHFILWAMELETKPEEQVTKTVNYYE